MLKVAVWFSLWLCIWSYEHFVAINCGSYDRTMVSTKYANYTSDTFFEGLASTTDQKQNVPDSIKNMADRQLAQTHRTTSEGYDTFSYQPIIRSNGKYLIIFMLVETEHRASNEHIFHIKVGEDVVHTVDVFAEVGYGKILHKWIEFELKDDIIYINGTFPALNGYQFKTHQVRFVFEGVKGKPKVQALLIVKGDDVRQYLDNFLSYEKEKNIMVKQYLADKYRKPIPRTHRILNATSELEHYPTEQQRLINRLFSLQSIAYICCAIFAIHHQFLFNLLKRKLHISKEKTQ